MVKKLSVCGYDEYIASINSVTYSGLDNGGSLSGQTLLFHTLVWECYSNWD